MDNNKALHRALRRLAGWGVWSFFSNVHVVGAENVPRDGPMIVCVFFFLGFWVLLFGACFMRVTFLLIRIVIVVLVLMVVVVVVVCGVGIKQCRDTSQYDD